MTGNGLEQRSNMPLLIGSDYYLWVSIVFVVQLVLQAEAFPRHATVVSRGLANATINYDFIIAGGGIAGLTLAERLTEVPEGIVAAKEYLSKVPKILSVLITFSICLGGGSWPIGPWRECCPCTRSLQPRPVLLANGLDASNSVE